VGASPIPFSTRTAIPGHTGLVGGRFGCGRYGRAEKLPGRLRDSVALLGVYIL
jgi:hypothetical protein